MVFSKTRGAAFCAVDDIGSVHAVTMVNLEKISD
jgi:hypothetical protein